MTILPTAPRVALQIQLEGFEGPLDLLLHLIRKHELDILDIPIAFVTDEYLRYLDAMHRLQLDVAGEYLVMAATLLHIKSKTLLPKREDDEEEEAGEDEGDPREALVRRLLEYQRYKDAANDLEDRCQLGEVFRRPSRADRMRDESGPAELLPLDLFSLLEAFRNLLDDDAIEAVHEVTQEKLSLRQTISEIATYLEEHPRTTLIDLIYAQQAEPTRLHIVVTFLAILEMAKLRLVKLFQARLSSSDLVVERAVIEPQELEQRLDGIDEY